VVLSLSSWLGVSAHTNHMLRATQEKARALAESIDRGIQVAMREGRHEEVGRLLEAAAQDPDVGQILIVNERGRVQQASRPELIGSSVSRDRIARYLLQPDLAVIELAEAGAAVQSVVKHIENRPECRTCHGLGPLVGLLYVDLSFRNTQAQIAEMEQTAIWTMLLAAAVLTAGAGLLMTRLVDRPVAALTRAITRVEAGDLKSQAVVHSDDELGRLAESFNAMIRRLAAARDEIEGYHQQRLHRAERLATLGELAASLTHEIKNPLAGIAGAIRVMADDLPEEDPRKPIMGEILEQVHRLDKTVQDLLAFAKPGLPALEPCDLHRTLDRVLVLLAENPSAKPVRILRQYDGGLPHLEADRQQLGQVFLNLLLNAIQAMPSGGQITIRTGALDGLTVDGAPRISGPAIEVAVEDTGPGIPAHALDDIFQPFFTLKHRGTGLGLSVSRRIVEDHGGALWAESPPGRGATFHVVLPLRPAGL